jgi:hypothetical protein
LLQSMLRRSGWWGRNGEARNIGHERCWRLASWNRQGCKQRKYMGMEIYHGRSLKLQMYGFTRVDETSPSGWTSHKDSSCRTACRLLSAASIQDTFFIFILFFTHRLMRGIVIRYKRIDNFSCSMLVLHQLLYVFLHFMAFLCIFRN